MEPNLARLLCGDFLHEREGIFFKSWGGFVVSRVMTRPVIAAQAAREQGIGGDGNGRGRAAMGERAWPAPARPSGSLAAADPLPHPSNCSDRDPRHADRPRAALPARQERRQEPQPSSSAASEGSGTSAASPRAMTSSPETSFPRSACYRCVLALSYLSGPWFGQRPKGLAKLHFTYQAP